MCQELCLTYREGEKRQLNVCLRLPEACSRVLALLPFSCMAVTLSPPLWVSELVRTVYIGLASYSYWAVSEIMFSKHPVGASKCSFIRFPVEVGSWFPFKDEETESREVRRWLRVTQLEAGRAVRRKLSHQR